MKFADSVKQTASLTSTTATFTPGAAVAQYRSLAQAIADTVGKPEQVSVGDVVCMRVDDVADPTKFEVADYTIGGTSSAPTLTRGTIRASSAGGTTSVTFGGAVTVLCTVPSAILARTSIDSDVPFSQSVPLVQVGTAYMPPYTVTGPLSFTPAAGAVKGAFSGAQVIADGSSAVTFPGFKQAIGSADYDNRAGILNVLEFSYDGYNYWYAISQAVGATPVDTTAPTPASAAVSNGTPTIVTLTASEALDPNNTPAASAFTVSGHTVTSVAVAGMTVNLTVSAAFANGEAARTLSYVQPGSAALRDQAGNLMASFSSLAVTNNVQPADTTPPTFGSAQVPNSTPTVIQVTMSETLAASVPPASAWSVSGGKTVTSVSVSGAVVSLTCSAAYANGDSITVTYTQPSGNPRLQDPANNVTASFGPVGVTNNIAAAAPAQYPRMATSTGESGTGPYSYTSSSSNYYHGFTQPAMAGDGYFIVRQEQYAQIAIGLHNTATPASESASRTPPVIMYAVWSGSGNWVPSTNYANVTAANTVAIANNGVANLGDWVRFKRTGTTVVCDVSKDQGSTWTVIYTWTGITGTLYPNIGAAMSFTLMGGAGLA